MTLTDFLLARIAEDEKVAQAASPGGWVHDGDGEVWRYSKELHAGWLISHPTSVSDADHIALHNPARVLAECEAKRRIVEMHAADQDEASDENWHGLCVKCGWAGLGEGYPCRTIRFLALPYADHPDYREEWKP